MSGDFYNAIEDIPPNQHEIQQNLERPLTINYLKNDFWCEICDVKVTSMKIFQRHLEGRKHKIRIERKDKIFSCDVCDIVANSEIQLNIHLNSQKHKNKLAKNEHFEFTSISSNTIGLWILFICVICIFINLLLLFKIVL